MSTAIPSPIVCICVPTYNASTTVAETLESILAQTYKNIIVHVSDNASTDNTLEVVDSIVDSRLFVHRNRENIGGEGNFTRCIGLASGKYTAIFHADDVYEPDMIARQVAYLEANSGIGAVFTAAITIDEKGRPLGAIGTAPADDGGVASFDFQKLFKAMLLQHNFLVCPSALVRTSIYQDAIKVWGNSEFKSASDVDTWLRIAWLQPIAVLSVPLMRYRISRKQYSHVNLQRTERADFFSVMDFYLAKPEVRSFLTPDDLRHYGWLERHERVACAMNLCALGRVSETKDLLNGVVCWDSILSAIKSRRGFVTLTGGILLSLLSFFGSSRIGVIVATYMRKISWR